MCAHVACIYPDVLLKPQVQDVMSEKPCLKMSEMRDFIFHNMAKDIRQVNGVLRISWVTNERFYR